MPVTPFSHLIRADVPKDAYFLHGTGHLSVKELLEQGTLHSTELLSIMNKDYQVTVKDRLYMVHNPRLLGGRFQLSNGSFMDEGLTLSSAYTIASEYALVHAQAQKYVELFGFFPESGEVDFSFRSGKASVNFFKKLIMPELRTKGFGVEDVKTNFMEISRQRGYVLALNEKGLELYLEVGKDEPGFEIAARVENGLDASYFSAIIPLGDLERKFLRSYNDKSTKVLQNAY